MSLETKMEKGVVFGVFDLMHVGHVRMFEWAKQHVDYLVVGVHSGVGLAPHKNKPILSPEERLYLVSSCKYVDEAFLLDQDEVVPYQAQHLDYVRFIGDDHKKSFTGEHLPIEKVMVHDRSHGYSTTSIRKRVLLSEIKD
mgnify:CR=1 FL=1